MLAAAARLGEDALIANVRSVKREPLGEQQSWSHTCSGFHTATVTDTPSNQSQKTTGETDLSSSNWETHAGGACSLTQDSKWNIFTGAKAKGKPSPTDFLSSHTYPQICNQLVSSVSAIPWQPGTLFPTSPSVLRCLRLRFFSLIWHL